MDNKREHLVRLIENHKNADFEINKNEILVLLNEFARRLLLWIKAIKEANVELDIGSTILFDVAYELTGQEEDFKEIESIFREKQLEVYYTDKNMLLAYYNWIRQKKVICQLGYNLPNPYTPYVEIFKRGGYVIKYKYSRLEVYPFYGINVEHEEDFIVNSPFWDGDIRSSELEEE